MRRYWMGQDVHDETNTEIEKIEIEISGDLFHHICGVCRQDVGSKFELLSEGQRAFLVEMISKSKKSAIVKIIETRALPDLKKPLIRLCISLPKFSTFETILEKSVELGVHRVQPFFSDCSFVREKSKVSPTRLERWDKIVKGACEQSGRSPLMKIEEVSDLKSLLKEWNLVNNQEPTEGLINRKKTVGSLFLYEGQGGQSLVPAIEDLKNQNLHEVWCFIGSEGGFSLREVEMFQSANMTPITLGDQVLRVETACLAAASIIKYGLNLF